ncbi:hypothetical protein FACS1894202_04540 [Clostridia bacterium]|nr:hypothetical protein FACS1894202_04540 [Clostridia bacterium]
MKRTNPVFWALFIGSAAAALINGGDVAYTLFYIMCGVLTCCVLFAVGVSVSVRVKCVTNLSYVVAGQPMKWRVGVLSRFFLPIPAMRVEFLPIPDADIQYGTLAVTPYKTAVMDTEVSFAYRGTYELGVKRWIAPDYLALFAARGRGNASQSRMIYVLPRILHPDAGLEPRPDMEVNSFSPLAVPEQDGTRPYQNTDTIRSIHWKLSAKTDDSFMVKKTRGAVPRPVRVVIDMTVGTELYHLRREREDKLLETALSLTRHLMDGGEVTVIVIGAETLTQRVSGRADFAELYRRFGPSEFEDGDFNAALSGLEDMPGSVLWLVTSHKGQGVRDALAMSEESYWLYVPANEVCSRDDEEALTAASAGGANARAILPDMSFYDCADLLGGAE